MSAPTSLRNPCMFQPLVGDELLHPKGVIIAYIIHSVLSSLGATSSNTKKNQEKAKG